MTDQGSCIFIFLACLTILSSNLGDNILYMGVTVFHTWTHGRLIEIQSNLTGKKLHRTNQGSNFLGGSLNNRDNVRSPVQFRRAQHQHFKIWFFLKNRPIHFHINRTSVIRLVKQNQLTFSSIEINNSILASVHSVS